MPRLNEARLGQLRLLPLRVVAPGPEPWELGGRDAFWVVVEGRVEVFAQELCPGQPEGHRHHLFAFEAGDVLAGLSFPPAHAGLKVVAVGAGSRLLSGHLGELPGPAQADLRNLLLGAFAEAVQGGVAGHVLAEGQPPMASLLVPGLILALGPGERTTLQEGQHWVRILAGEAQLLGDPECPLRPGLGSWPLAKSLWLLAGAAGATVQCLGPDELPDGDGVPALERILACLMAVEGRRFAAQEQERLDRLRRKADAEMDRRHRSLAALAGLLGPREGVPLPIPGAGAVLDACRMVGQHSGIRFLAPPKWIQEDPGRDQLTAICRVSRVRLRRVALRGAWWRQDSGALLGWLGAARLPVALLPRGREGGYLMRTGPGQPPVPLDEDQASQLEPFACAFFRPGPARRMGALDLARLTWHDIRGDLGWVLGMALVSGMVGLALPVTLGLMMGQVIPQANHSAVWVLLLCLVGLALGTALFDLTRGLALLRVEGKAGTTLQAAVIDRLLGLPVTFFRAFTVGDLARRATAVDQAHALLSGATVTTLISAVCSALQFALLFHYCSQLAWVALGLALLAAAFYGVLAWCRAPVEALRQASSGALSGLVFGLLSGLSKLRVAAAEGRAFAVWCERLWADRRLELRANSLALRLKVFNETLPLVSLLTIFSAVDLFLNGPEAQLKPADFVAFHAAFGTFIASATTLSASLMNLQQVKPIFDRARPILETASEDDSARPDPGRLRGHIEANHLTFRYRADGPQILQDVSFHAAPGEFVAFVGASGCGKSTTLRLLLGFEQPETGAIYYDQQNLGAVDIGSLRSQIGVVLQGSSLMGGSIWQNIVGAGNLTLNDAWAAAEAAGFADDVRDMPMGMHTVISEGCGLLSGGQRQRLLIARALVRQPRIILFDEATSALDNRTQAIVSRSLERTSATRIVIAHRLSTIQNADRIYVFDRGRIVQSGAFQELSEAPGLFRLLAQRQMV